MDTWIAIGELRQQPILAKSYCVFEIKTGRGGSWKEVSETTIPKGWEEAAHVVQRQNGVVVIVGDVDSGKSSLCGFVANMCLLEGLRVGIVDGDVGQTDVGPATTISSSHPTESILSLQDLHPEISFFAGDTSPSLVPDKVIQSIVRLKNNIAKNTDVVLVNTDGWVADSTARRFKENLLHEIQPDLVLGLSREGEIDPLLDIIQFASLRLATSRYARTRSKDERKSAREAGYRRFLAGSSLARINQDATSLRMFHRPSQSILRWERKFRGFLAGLLDKDQRLMSVGRIREISDGNAWVETTAIEDPTFLEVGNIVLSSSYEEVGYGILH
jgi:polynucleotide 5'-kinase involved in rRNA processing